MVLLKFSSFLPLHVLRIAILKAAGARLGRDVVFYHGYEVRAARRLRVGEKTSVGNGTVLDARGGITIGRNVNISTQVQVWTGQHDWQSPTFAFESRPVFVGDNAWLSARCIILPGVTVGNGAVVAAGAVVAKNVPDGVVVAGVPAQIVRHRPEVAYELRGRRGKSWWW